MSNKEVKTKKKTTQKSMFLKTFLIILAVLVVIFGIVAGVGYWYIQDKLGKIDYDDLSASEIDVNEGVKESLSKYRNIAILGIDARQDVFSDSRSDCMIIASINQETNEVKLLSIYRDTYVRINDAHPLDKITHAFAYGGAKLALSTINTNLDLNITEYVTVNFDTVKTLVEAVGGIPMKVTSAEATQISGISGAGTYTLNGEQALAYARIRKIDSDYKRTERMRDVIDAIFSKAKKMNIGQLNSLVDTMLPHVRTNITANEILGLLPSIASYSIGESVGWPYKTRGITLDRWYGVPITLESNVKQLHADLFGEADYTPSTTVQEISQKIVKKTGYTE